MSIKLMTAAWDAHLASSEKLVLLALADWANDEGLCWPSIQRLVEKTGVKERTIQGCIKSLAEAGHLTRNEVVGKGVNYIVHPRHQNEMQGYTPPETHYVYRITDPSTGHFYIGARSCSGDAETDKYMGSGNWVKAKIALGVELKKQIVQIYASREALSYGELAHVSGEFQSELCCNTKLPTPGTLVKTGYRGTPAYHAPRNNCAPQKTAQTPAKSAPNTSVTTIKDVANATSKARAKRKAAFALPDWVPADAWAGYEQMRCKARKPMTDRARALALTKLQELAASGHPPGGVLDQSTLNNWQGLFEIKERNNGNSMGRHHGQGGGERRPSASLDWIERNIGRTAEADEGPHGMHSGAFVAIPGSAGR